MSETVDQIEDAFPEGEGYVRPDWPITLVDDEVGLANVDGLELKA